MASSSVAKPTTIALIVSLLCSFPFPSASSNCISYTRSPPILIFLTIKYITLESTSRSPTSRSPRRQEIEHAWFDLGAVLIKPLLSSLSYHGVLAHILHSGAPDIFLQYFAALTYCVHGIHVFDPNFLQGTPRRLLYIYPCQEPVDPYSQRRPGALRWRRLKSPPAPSTNRSYRHDPSDNSPPGSIVWRVYLWMTFLNNLHKNVWSADYQIKT